MKKITLLLLLVMPVIAFSQNAKLTNAINYYEDFAGSKNKDKDLESITKAKENIDIVAANPEMKDPAKVLKYKGLIYLAIYENNLRIQTNKVTDVTDATKKAFIGYQNTPITELDIAAKAIAGISALDPKVAMIYKWDISQANTAMFNHYFNKANADFNVQKFDSSLQMFEKAYELDEAKDTNTLNNMGLAALNSKNFEKAKTTYGKMVELKVGGSRSYSLLVDTYFELKDTASGVEVLKKARALYPTDGNLLNTETNYFLSHNKRDEALKNLNAVILSRPQEANLYLVRGGIYDKQAHPEDANHKPLPKPANYNELMKLAEADYQKTVDLSEPAYKNISSLSKEEQEQLRETYSNGLFDIGAIYFNNGAEIAKDADRITDNAKFAAENKKANAFFNKAMPILEKALEVKPEERTMLALKQIYSRLEIADKLKSINERLKG